ncbi:MULTISPECIES: hypothetical protein [unclassified Streptomyces]|uniref:hypothetical protein n=1 Tax=unclassified Streptomyces TaxID=2593676 RepID=UPI000B29C315|nr:MULTISPECIES: hypothetical protein [unclassified Streptomyces]MCH0559038.1 hypothetical protein [Streptomyces sp. MUM 16J]
MTTHEPTSQVRYYEDLGCRVVWGRDQDREPASTPPTTSLSDSACTTASAPRSPG